MNLCRFLPSSGQIRLGLMADPQHILDISAAGIIELSSLFEDADLPARLFSLARESLPRLAMAEVKRLAPLDRQEVWAAGVTYLRSKAARMEESQFSASAYDRVYDAERPELFFKSLPEKVAGPEDPIGIREDARWSVPEPELALVISPQGRVVGYTIGNDMSARDIEGENVLYLPQAKIYRHSCALGPTIKLGVTEAEVRGWRIRLEIRRADQVMFTGETALSQIKRGFAELAGFLYRSQSFPHGAVLLTGTGIVPPDSFTLQAGDRVTITIPEIGTLDNQVQAV